MLWSILFVCNKNKHLFYVSLWQCLTGWERHEWTNPLTIFEFNLSSSMTWTKIQGIRGTTLMGICLLVLDRIRTLESLSQQSVLGMNNICFKFKTRATWTDFQRKTSGLSKSLNQVKGRVTISSVNQICYKQ